MLAFKLISHPDTYDSPQVVKVQFSPLQQGEFSSVTTIETANTSSSDVSGVDDQSEHTGFPGKDLELGNSSGIVEEGAASGKETRDKVGDDDDDDQEEEDMLGFRFGIFWLGIVSFVIAILSEALASTIEKAGEDLKLSGVFLAAIVLPIVGNAAEHAGAVMFAMKNKVDLSLGIAIGSSTQIGLFVLPLLVVLGWMIDRPLDMDFGNFESYTLLLTIITVTFAIKDGTSHWLTGFVLISVYVVISTAFFVLEGEAL
jgi:calcium/proton exchanger cax